MLIFKHLKTLQHVSIIIQIIFREFVSSLLKSLNLKFKNIKGQQGTYELPEDDLNNDRNILECF